MRRYQTACASSSQACPACKKKSKELLLVDLNSALIVHYSFCVETFHELQNVIGEIPHLSKWVYIFRLCNALLLQQKRNIE